jgi:hypothetical protein
MGYDSDVTRYGKCITWDDENLYTRTETATANVRCLESRGIVLILQV